MLGFCTGLCSGFGVPVIEISVPINLSMRKDIFHGALLTAVIAHPGQQAALLSMDSQDAVCNGDIYGNARIYILIIFLDCHLPLYNFLSHSGVRLGTAERRLFLAFSACLNVVLIDLYHRI
ncbi:MAG: hypothetical protein ACLR5Q_05120 [Coprococcus sp.]